MKKNKFLTKELIIIMILLLTFSFINTIKYGSIIFFIALIIIYIVILTIKFPVYMNVLVLVVWYSFKFLLVDIRIGSISASQISMIIVIPILIIGLIVRSHQILKKTFIDKSIVIYILLTIFSALGLFTTELQSEALISYIKLFGGLLILIFYSKCIKNTKELEFLKRGLIFIGINSSIVTFLGAYAGLVLKSENLGILKVSTLYYGGVYRPVGIAGGPVANGILLYLLIMFIRAIRETKEKKNKYIFIEIIYLLALFISLTRTVILAIIFAYILEKIILKFSLSKTSKFLLLTVLAGIVIILVLPESFKEIILARFTDFDSGNVNDFGAGRIGIWGGIIKGLISNFNILNLLIGYGIDMSPIFVEQYSVFMHKDATHNDFLDIFLTNGLIGFIILIVFYLNIIIDLLKFKNKSFVNTFISWILGYYLIILNLSNTNYSADQRWLFLLVVFFFFSKERIIRFEKDIN